MDRRAFLVSYDPTTDPDGRVLERLLDGPLPWTRMRQAYQLVRLCDRYGASRVDAACARALEFDVLDVPRLGRLLKRDFEREMLAEDEGALAQLSQHPRFGRHDDEFRTRGQKGEEQ